MRTKLELVEAPRSNPKKEDAGEAAIYIGVAGGVGFATYWVAGEATKAVVEAAIEGKTGTEAVEATRNALAISGVAKVGGGLGVGIAGRVMLDEGLGQAFTDGIGVGLIISGGGDIKQAIEVNDTLQQFARA
jgi:hypothetical protein